MTLVIQCHGLLVHWWHSHYHHTLVAQQLPTLPKFTGEATTGGGGGETVGEWLEQLDLVAAASHWDEPTNW